MPEAVPEEDEYDREAIERAINAAVNEPEADEGDAPDELTEGSGY